MVEQRRNHFTLLRMRVRSQRGWLVLLTLSAALPVIGCSDKGERVKQLSAEDESTIDELQALLGAPDAPLLLISRAESTLVGRCMKSKGFELKWPVAAPLEFDTGTEMRQFTEAEAESIGYEKMQSPVVTESSSIEAQREADAALVEGGEPMERALFGDGETVSVQLPDGSTGNTVSNGCLADARRALWGEDLEVYARGDMISKNLLPQIVTRTQLDSRMSSVLSDWRDCMALEGHRLESVSEAIATRGSPQETAVALADARCRQTTRLAEVYKQVFSSVAAAVMDESGDALREYLTQVTDVAAEAVSLAG